MFNQLFYFFQDTMYFVIMRLSWMMKTNSLIDWVTMTWRYIIIKNRMTLETFENFTISMNKNIVIYALMCSFESLKNEFKKILMFISNFKHMFDSKSTSMLITHDEHNHDIDLMLNKTSSYEFLYNMFQKKFKTFREYIQKNLALNKIKHSIIDVEAFVLFVFKKNEKFRLCVNYKNFNVITIKNKVSLSLINETLNRLINVAYFTKLDLKNVYHKIRIREKNEWKTTFRTRYELFEYAMMSFDLVNASTIFQTFINKTLSDLIDRICVIYLNNILIFFETQKKHWKHVKLILKRFRQFNLFVKLVKCRFMIISMKFLNYIVNNHEMSMNFNRVKAIKIWSILTSLRQLQIFLNFVNFYRRFVVKYVNISRSLSKLLKSNKNDKQIDDFIWNSKIEKTFRQHIDMFIKTSMLIHFNFNEKILVETNASSFAIDVVISQLIQTFNDQAQWHSIAFYFKKIIFAKTKYSTHDQELLIVIESFKQWKHYLKEIQLIVIVVSNHNNLKYFMITISLNKRQIKWILLLKEYVFEIKYKVNNFNFVDASSRRSNYEKRKLNDICLSTF